MIRHSLLLLIRTNGWWNLRKARAQLYTTGRSGKEKIYRLHRVILCVA
jgi:hypothetical protein